MQFTITVKATSVTVSPGSEAIPLLSPLLNMLTYEDDFVEEVKIIGYMLDENTDTLYLHKGVDIQFLHRLLRNINIVRDEYDEPLPMNFEYEEIMPPRNDLQIDVINFLMGKGIHSSNLNMRQIFLILGTGKGKTYCACTAACKMGIKTLIITHRESIREQWGKTLLNMMGMSKRDICILDDGETLRQIADGELKLDYDVYLLTHHTFRAAFKHVDGNMNTMRRITKNLGIGIKIIDEAHLEFRDTLMMDFAFNVQRNIYMTATFGRSSKDENSIFKYVFANAELYNPNKIKMNTNTPSKWVEYYIIEVNSHCPPNMYRYKVMSGRGMSPASYGKFVIKIDKKQTHFNVCKELLRMIYEKDDKAKVIVFMPLIELCSEAAYFFKMNLNYDDSFGYDLSIKTINSENTKSENESNKRADVIVTTVASCGTGTDIPGITDIICCSPFKSSITAIQVFGRLRYCGKICHYYDIVDASVQMDKFFHKSRSKVMKQNALCTKYLTWENDTDSDKK